jgi:hypothetical protein
MAEDGDALIRTVVQVQTPEGAGTGVRVTQREILTAAHVVGAFDPADVTVLGAAWSGKQSPEAVTRHARPEDIDLALLRLPAGAHAQFDEVASVARDPNGLLNVGDQLTLHGHRDDRGVERDTAQIVKFDGRAHSWVLNKAVPEGYSGGPVTIDARIVGLTFARDFSAGRTYAVPLPEIVSFLEGAAEFAVSYASSG